MPSATLRPDSMLSTAEPGGLGMPILERNASNRCLSDAVSIESAVDPKIGNPAWSSF